MLLTSILFSRKLLQQKPVLARILRRNKRLQRKNQGKKGDLQKGPRMLRKLRGEVWKKLEGVEAELWEGKKGRRAVGDQKEGKGKITWRVARAGSCPIKQVQILGWLTFFSLPPSLPPPHCESGLRTVRTVCLCTVRTAIAEDRQYLARSYSWLGHTLK